MLRWERHPLGAIRQACDQLWGDERGGRQGELEIAEDAPVSLSVPRPGGRRADSGRVTTKHVYDLAWSPDGEFFIAGSTDNTATIWKASTGQLLYTRKRRTS